MKHNIFKSIVFGAIFLGTIAAHAQLEANQVYLVTCQTAEDPYQQIAFKGANVLRADGSDYEYIVMDVETGNQTFDGFGDADGEGLYPKYTQSLFNSSSADYELFTQNSSTNYSLVIEYNGTETSSDIRVDFDLDRRTGLFTLDLNGAGPMYDMLMVEFTDVMSNSDFYGRFDMPTCTSHPDLRNFLD